MYQSTNQSYDYFTPWKSQDKNDPSGASLCTHTILNIAQSTAVSQWQCGCMGDMRKEGKASIIMWVILQNTYRDRHDTWYVHYTQELEISTSAISSNTKSKFYVTSSFECGVGRSVFNFNFNIYWHVINKGLPQWTEDIFINLHIEHTNFL